MAAESRGEVEIESVMRNYQLSAISYQLLAEALVFPHCTMVLTLIHFCVLGCLRARLPSLASRRHTLGQWQQSQISLPSEFYDRCHLKEFFLNLVVHDRNPCRERRRKKVYVIFRLFPLFDPKRHSAGARSCSKGAFFDFDRVK